MLQEKAAPDVSLGYNSKVLFLVHVTSWQKSLSMAATHSSRLRELPLSQTIVIMSEERLLWRILLCNFMIWPKMIHLLH